MNYYDMLGGNPLRTLSGHTSAVHSIHCERFVLLSCDISGRNDKNTTNTLTKVHRLYFCRLHVC